MSAWWQMRCDDGHGWSVFVEDDSREPDATQLNCPEDDSPAVTATCLPIADRVQISMLPAAWEREGRVGRADEYFLEVRSILDSSRMLKTTTTMSWEDVIKYASMFRDIPWDLAERRWARMFSKARE
ncbi:hypothetical protein [Streptomyces phaeochromogenes]